jgi:hypothetical protein
MAAEIFFALAKEQDVSMAERAAPTTPLVLAEPATVASATYTVEEKKVCVDRPCIRLTNVQRQAYDLFYELVERDEVRANALLNELEALCGM